MRIKSHRPFAPGSSPAHAIAAAAPDAREACVAWIRYDGESFDEDRDGQLEAALEGLAAQRTDWLHFGGAPQPAVLRWLHERLGLDPLALEDVLNGNQRSKLEPFEGHSFFVLNVPALRDGEIVLEQLSLFLGPHWLISVWPGESALFEPVRERLRSGGTGRIRKRGAEYLFYTLLDAAVDSMFPVLEILREEVELLEEALIGRSDEELLGVVHRLRRNLVILRRLALPGQEALGQLLRTDDSPLSAATRRYVRDVLDHHMRIADLVENLAEVVRGLHELYLTNLSHEMNEVMRLLTIIATIFIPLSFLAGVWGMNFNPEASPWNMPELNARFGYPVAILAMLSIGGGMLWMFRRRGWL